MTSIPVAMTDNPMTYEQGSTKLLSLLSKIIETPEFGRNFVLETTRKKLKQSCFCDRILILSQKQISVTETSFCNRNGQEQVYVTETSFCQRNNFLQFKQVSLTQANFCLKRSVCLKKSSSSLRKKFLLQNKIAYICFCRNTKISLIFREFRKKKLW